MSAVAKSSRTLGRDVRDPQTSLPTALLDQLPDNHPHPTNTHTTTTVSRKAARKQRRIEKRRAVANAQQQWRMRRSSIRPPLSSPTPTPSTTQHPPTHSRNLLRPVSAPAPVPNQAPDVVVVAPSKSKKRKRTSSPAHHDDLPEDPDAREATRLEKLLGINNRRKKSLSATFSYAHVFPDGEDDLADLLNFCDSTRKNKTYSSHPPSVTPSTPPSPHDEISTASGQSHQPSASAADDIPHPRCSPKQTTPAKSPTQRDPREENSENSGSLISSDDDEDDPEDDDYEEDDSDIDIDDVDYDDLDNDERNIQGSSALAHRHKPSSNSAPNTNTASRSIPPTTQQSSKRSASDIPEISSSKRDSSVRNASKYVPPSARKRTQPSADAIKRRLRGLLNRVADINASGIADSLVQLFRASDNGLSLRDLASLYANAALNSSRDGSGVAQVNPYVQSHAAIATHLAKQVDLIILSTLLVLAVRRMVSTLEKGDAAVCHGPDGATDTIALDDARTEAFGYIAILCALYTRGAIASRVVYDLVRTVANNLNGFRLEALLFILRQLGPQLRMDDPSSLKEVIEFIYDQSANLKKDNDDPNVKLEIMLDLISDIKNNKLRKSAVKEAQAKFSWASVPEDPLSASINDLLDDDFVAMRWWDDTKGLTVAERRGIVTPKKNETRTEEIRTANAEEGPDLATLAVSLRMNTDYRRALFRSIMSSANVSDAFDRLENMSAFDSKKGNDRDTALVILHCCGAEKEYNAFYAALAERVCQRSRRLRFTFEFALWDVFKAIPGSAKVAAMTKRKMNNYANLLTHLWKSGAISLSVLRCVTDFEGCGEHERHFYTHAVKLLIRELVAKANGQLAPFEKLAEETWNGVDDFCVQFTLFLRGWTNSLTESENKLVCRGLKMLESKNG